MTKMAEQTEFTAENVEKVSNLVFKEV